MTILNTFSLESNKQIKINFNGGELSSDGGLLIAMLLLRHLTTSLAFNSMQSAGHVFLHFPQPMHKDVLTTAKQPFHTQIAFVGHSCVQAPQETHRFLLTSE